MAAADHSLAGWLAAAGSDAMLEDGGGGDGGSLPDADGAMEGSDGLPELYDTDDLEGLLSAGAEHDM
jgi:hypothetical protein